MQQVPSVSRRQWLQLAGAGTAAAWLPGCAVPPAHDASFAAWSEDYAADWMRLTPEWATRLQFFDAAEQARIDAMLSPRTPQQRARVVALAREGVARIDAAGWARNPGDEATYRAAATMRWALALRVSGERFEDHGFVFDQWRGMQVSLVNLLTVGHPLRRASDVPTWLARLEQVASRLDQGLQQARASAARGLRPPRFIVERARGQLSELLKPVPGEDVFVAALSRRTASLTDLDAAARSRAVAQATALVAQQVRPALVRVAALLDEMLPTLNDDAGLWRLPDGEAAYAHALAANTTTSMGAAEIHAIGLREVARIEGEMDGLLRGLGYRNGTVNQRLRALQDSLQPPAEPDPRPALLARYTAYVREAERLAQPLFHRAPQAPVEVRRVPPLTERTMAAHYTAPTPDGSEPGVFWAPLPGPRFGILGMKTLSIHEAVPGHHFQIALMREQADLPRWRRLGLFGGGSAYTEGWALYAEALAVEQGWYEGDPHSLLGAHAAQLFRARRLVVDTGLHSLRWTRQQAIDYGISASEVERYVANPGQACAYMVGMLRLQALREEARQARGARFTLPDFHDVVLRAGSVPLDVLDDTVRRWARS